MHDSVFAAIVLDHMILQTYFVVVPNAPDLDEFKLLKPRAQLKHWKRASTDHTTPAVRNPVGHVQSAHF